MSTKITPSEMYAIGNNARCEGDLECHWCATPCRTAFRHDDLSPILIGGRREHTKRPVSPYICTGCCLYRRKRVTIWYPDGNFKDGQCAIKNSWYYGKYECLALKKGGGALMYPKLLNPSLFFVLALIDDGMDNPIQLHRSNCFESITSSMELEFTYNSKPYTYTINELEHALRNGANGASPGTGLLVKYFGEHKLEDKEEKEKKGPGRPFKEDERPSRIPDRIVRMKK